MAAINFVVLTVSDTCYAKTKEDRSGPKLEELILFSFPNSRIIAKRIVPDDKSMIAKYLTKASREGCNVILTTGGTGFSARDVTPEATKSVIDKEAPGLSYAMISKSLAITDMAALSRAVCGIKNQSLIINLPGSVKGATECFECIKSVIPHAVTHLLENRNQIASDHKHIQNLGLPNEPSKVKLQVAFRNRESPYAMVSVCDAIQAIFAHCPNSLSTEIIDTVDSLNRVLSENVYARDPLPPFNASCKDGYAVKVADGPGIRKVREAITAGEAPLDELLASGEIVRISTGAAIPTGADAVVQVEDTELIEASEDGTIEKLVEINVQAKLYQDIRLIGSDIAADALILDCGDYITAAHIGVLATVGQTKICVYRRATVGILSTGNELQDSHETLKPGHIRDSNKLSLTNLLKYYSFEANDCGIARDNPDSVKRALYSAFTKYDVVITSGGVSMGEYDVIKAVLVQDFDATIHFGRVNMKPGKPTTFATCNFGGQLKLIFGLPGNPVSSMVTCILFVIPALRYLENHNQPCFAQIPVVLGVDVPSDPRPEFMRIKLKHSREKTLKAYPVGNQISSRLNSFVTANALLHIPNTNKKKAIYKAGEVMEAFLLAPLNMECE